MLEILVQVIRMEELVLLAQIVVVYLFLSHLQHLLLIGAYTLE